MPHQFFLLGSLYTVLYIFHGIPLIEELVKIVYPSSEIVAIIADNYVYLGILEYLCNKI